jgi:hypothetical protein
VNGLPLQYAVDVSPLDLHSATRPAQVSSFVMRRSLQREVQARQHCSVIAGAGAVEVYEKDDGAENAYFGRGYVQLTWWSNYAKAGAALGRGLDLQPSPPRTAPRARSHHVAILRGIMTTEQRCAAPHEPAEAQPSCGRLTSGTRPASNEWRATRGAQ